MAHRYIPKYNDKFQAFVITRRDIPIEYEHYRLKQDTTYYGHIAYDAEKCLCKGRTKIGGGHICSVNAVDTVRNKRVFDTDKFYFIKIYIDQEN